VSSRTAKATQRNPVSKKQTNKQTNKKKRKEKKERKKVVFYFTIFISDFTFTILCWAVFIATLDVYSLQITG
jgi:hypothetical protein